MNHEQLEIARLTIELEQMRKAAVLLAGYILAQPAVGMEALSEVRRTANAVMAANGLPQGQGAAE